MKNKQILILAESAILLGLATALSLVKIFPLPFGGSVTLLSMLPIALVSIKYGIKTGLPIAFLYSAIQLLLDLGAVAAWGLTPKIFAGMVFLDYLFAFTAIGLAGVFRKKGVEAQILGVAMALTLRFCFHFLSGVVLWGEFAALYDWTNGNIYLYSLVYNGAYMFPEIIFTAIGAALLLKTPYVRKLFAVEG